MIHRLAALFALTVVPSIAGAQAAKPGLPLISVDGVVGGLSRPDRTGPTYYRSQHHPPVARLGVAVRIGRRAGLRPVAVLDYSGVWGAGDYVSDCPPAPNGGCKQYFPRMSGLALGLGVRSTLGSTITFGVTGGIGRYRLKSDTIREGTTGFHADAEASFRFTKHVGVVLNVRHIEAEKFRGGRMWYRPITFGIRIQ